MSEKRVVAIVRHADIDEEVVVDLFEVTADTTDQEAEAAFRNAVAEWLGTDEGKTFASRLEDEGEEPTWGNVMSEVPDEILERHGLRYLRDSGEVHVDNKAPMLF